MKSKSFDLKKSSSEKGKANKSFDFVSLYKSAAETNVIPTAIPKTVENLDNEHSFGTSVSSARELSPSKKKKKGKNEAVHVSIRNINGDSLDPATPGNKSSEAASRATSTPNVNQKTSSAEPKVKSIMKNSVANADEAIDSFTLDTPTFKSKKRNKSVSFMLDETEEIATKKTKPDESVTKKPEKPAIVDKVAEYKKLKKLKKSQQAEKENKSSMETNTETPVKKSKKEKSIFTLVDATGGDSSDGPAVAQEKKKKFKKFKKEKKIEDSSDPIENDSNNNEETIEKRKKLKKKKRVKLESIEGEPAPKLKKEVVPEVIAQDLENLNIGDNAHTLTNLLDEMTVVDKDKKKKNKLRRKKEKSKKSGSVSSSETAELEKIEEGKEKIKWKKRKWNKDKKGDVDADILATSVIIDNLPIKIMCNYKKMLAERFGNLGLIKRIGIAELYPTEEPKPVFTTSIVFYSEGAAEKALEEDNTLFEGSRIRVKKPLPPTQTTVVVRSYAELTDQSLSSVFTSAGRIRNIRQLMKGKKAMATAFIEFDGPEAVERALKMAEDAKIGGKKIHVAKFELRASKSKRKQMHKSNADSANEGDSENSND